MALPIITSLEECASVERTVLPYLAEIEHLPQLIPLGTAGAELKNFYLDANPLSTAFLFSLFLAPLFLATSEINKNFSQVDRLWSILPSVYNAHFVAYAHLAGLNTRRLDLLLACSCFWSIRLTFNYFRKGGYSKGSEDYRWHILREKIPAPLFFIFNVVFICLTQSILLFLITTPTYIILLASQINDAIATPELFFPLALLGLVIFEFIADQQQWNYQEAKRKYLQTARVPRNYRQEDLDRGFVVTGLWSISRHPNFVLEQTFWLVQYSWACWVSNVFYNWSSVGAFSYILLFQGSTWFTELITTGKYPEYARYQKMIGKFIPNFSISFRGVALVRYSPQNFKR